MGSKGVVGQGLSPGEGLWGTPPAGDYCHKRAPGLV